jgi:hypothetical protein
VLVKQAIPDTSSVAGAARFDLKKVRAKPKKLAKHLGTCSSIASMGSAGEGSKVGQGSDLTSQTHRGRRVKQAKQFVPLNPLLYPMGEMEHHECQIDCEGRRGSAMYV